MTLYDLVWPCVSSFGLAIAFYGHRRVWSQSTYVTFYGIEWPFLWLYMAFYGLFWQYNKIFINLFLFILQNSHI